MQPQQPYYPPAPAPAPPPNTGQYDFITGGPYQQPRSFGTQSPKKMVLVVVIGALVVIGLLWLILSMVFSSGDNKLTPLVGIAQQQTEIERIIDNSTQNDRISGQDVQNFATTTKLTIDTDKADLLSLMSKNGLNVKDKQLSATEDNKTDAALDAANANGTYDSTFVSIMQDELKTYQNSIKQTYNNTASKVERDVLSTQYDNASLLLAQAEQHS